MANSLHVSDGLISFYEVNAIVITSIIEYFRLSDRMLTKGPGCTS